MAVVIKHANMIHKCATAMVLVAPSVACEDAVALLNAIGQSATLVHVDITVDRVRGSWIQAFANALSTSQTIRRATIKAPSGVIPPHLDPSAAASIAALNAWALETGSIMNACVPLGNADASGALVSFSVAVQRAYNRFDRRQ
jgi:hypothetical protein